MSMAASRLVTAQTIGAAAGAPVITGDELKVAWRDYWRGLPKLDALLVMPATANVIAKAALGIADDGVSSAILTAPAQVLFVPSMNQSMWTSGVVRRNVRTLRDFGYSVIEPDRGIEAADFSEGMGGMGPIGLVLHSLLAGRIAASRPAASWSRSEPTA